MIKGITKSGFKFEVNEKAINDWEYSKLVNKYIVYEKKVLKSSEVEDNESDIYEKINNMEIYQDTLEKVLEKLLKEDGKDAFFEFIKNKNDGYIVFSDVQFLFGELISEITKLSNEAKKSMPSPTS